MSISKYKFCLFLLLFSFSKFGIAGGWIGGVKVTSVYPSSNGNIYFQFSSFNNPDNCPSSPWIVVKPINLNQKAIYATLMAAQIAKIDVAYYVSGCDSYPILTDVHTQT